jgi:PAS domain S-box-containing protein
MVLRTWQDTGFAGDMRTFMGRGDLGTALWTLRSSWPGYAWTVATTAAAAVVLWLLPEMLSQSPYLVFYPAVVVSALLGGVGPGLAAAFGALILVNFVFGRFHGDDAGALTQQVIWIAASAGVSLLAGVQRKTGMGERRQTTEARGPAGDSDVALIDKAGTRQGVWIDDGNAGSSDRLKGIVDSAMDAIISIDTRQNVVLFNEAAEKMFQRRAEDVLGKQLALLMPLRFANVHARHIEGFAKTGVSSRGMGNLGALSALRADGSEFPIEASISQTFNEGEKLFTAIVRDITERKQAEDMQRMLLAELDHRVKNTLATVQAIAMQTLNAKMDPAAFVEAFSGRIRALGCAHGLLSRSGWQGADLAQLVDEQLRLGGESKDARISTCGPHIMLEPQAALHLGLVLHELGANARKYGSLSQPAGRLAANWRVNGNSARPSLRFRWSESNGPPVAEPERRGFGTTLIERSLSYALGGEARLDFAPGGLTCLIRLPLFGGGRGAYSLKPPESLS